MSQTDPSPKSSPGSPSTQPDSIWLLIGLVGAVLLNGLDIIAPPLGVPLAVLLIWLLLRRWKLGWSHIGMQRPESWPRTIAIGIAFGLLMQITAAFAFIPLVEWLTGVPTDLSQFAELKGNVGLYLAYLAVAWTTAGIGEEIVWRGWFMTIGARLLGNGGGAWIAALLASSTLFGMLHVYQGPSGMLSTGLAGLGFGIVYLISGRNLWISICAHIFMNTLVFTLLFLGFEFG